MKSWTCGETCDNHPEITEIETFKNDTTQGFGYFAYNTYLDTIVIVFRGTENWANTKEDASTFYSFASFEICKGCEIHNGFRVAF